MDKSKVFFTTFRTNEHENLLDKLRRLIKTAGFETIDFAEKYTAIKLHFGEYGNLAFLRPNYAKVVADYVKELGPKSKEISYPYAAFACQMGLIPPSDTIDSLKHLGIL